MPNEAVLSSVPDLLDGASVYVAEVLACVDVIDDTGPRPLDQVANAQTWDILKISVQIIALV